MSKDEINTGLFDEVKRLQKETKRLQNMINDTLLVAEPLEDWHEDDSDCLWWHFPVVEPPYCGSPLDMDFPDYVTHFTRIIAPTAP